MPIKRHQINNYNIHNSLFDISKNTVRKLKTPLSSDSWKEYILTELNVDMSIAEYLFDNLVDENVLIFINIRKNESIYISDRLPQFKSYMWSEDIYKKL